MWSAVFFFSFISAVSAAPLSKFYSFLPHYSNQIPSGPSNQGLTTPISMEIFLPPRLWETAAGGSGAGTNSISPGVPAHLQPGVNAPISIEVFHTGFQGTAAGGQGSGTVSLLYCTQGCQI
ncbi:secretory calcium-binding phosphoprotein 5 [Tachysurus ichikawai]